MSTSARAVITGAATLVITALSVTLWSNTALAGPPTSSIVVPFRDLDLATDVGVQALYERIKTAAKRVCFHETDGQSLVDKQAVYIACYRDTIGNAVKQVGEARLAAVHRAQSRLAANWPRSESHVDLPSRLALRGRFGGSTS